MEAGVPESEFLRQRGAAYRFIAVDLLGPRDMRERRPAAVEQFLAIMDDSRNYPVLIHCRAGLHRTGVMVALYRMEYEGWTLDEAIRELKLNGFGDSNCTARNDYIQQYLLAEKPQASRNHVGTTFFPRAIRAAP
jgi:protein-tyrosine phosphatase